MDEKWGSIGVNSQENTAMPDVLGQESVVYVSFFLRFRGGWLDTNTFVLHVFCTRPG